MSLVHWMSSSTRKPSLSWYLIICFHLIPAILCVLWKCTENFFSHPPSLFPSLPPSSLPLFLFLSSSLCLCSSNFPFLSCHYSFTQPSEEHICCCFVVVLSNWFWGSRNIAFFHQFRRVADLQQSVILWYSCATVWTLNVLQKPEVCLIKN